MVFAFADPAYDRKNPSDSCAAFFARNADCRRWEIRCARSLRAGALGMASYLSASNVRETVIVFLFAGEWAALESFLS